MALGWCLPQSKDSRIALHRRVILRKNAATKLRSIQARSAPTETPNTEEVKPEEGEQFSKLTDLIQGIADSQSKLETEFAELKKEVPGQENKGEGQSKKVEAL